jgi:OmpA-OmpF porin, OOP family
MSKPILPSSLSSARLLSPRLLSAPAALAFTASALLLITGLALAPTGAQAQQATNSNGYLQSSGGTVRSGFGLCWRTGYWTPQMATEECDPDLVPKKPAPPPAPKPVVAAPPPPPAPAPAPKPVTIQKISLTGDALFDFDKSVVKPEGREVLDRLASEINGAKLQVVIAVGHTDWTGPGAYNQKLSERRAEAVKAYLITKGVPADLIQTSGRGETEPVADNKTREGRAQNRRVEVELRGERTVR